VCCLEQDFPIAAHTPIIAREVLVCGACLVGSTEVIRKLPNYSRMPDGYGCVAIDDVQDVEALSARLAALARDPGPIATVAARGRAFAHKQQADTRDPDRLERLLTSVARKRFPSKPRRGADRPAEAEDPRFPLTQLAAKSLQQRAQAGAGAAPSGGAIDLPQARAVLAAVESVSGAGDSSQRSVAAAIKLEIAIAEVEDANGSGPPERLDPLFRLRARRWALAEGALADLVPVRDPQLRMLTFDVADLVGEKSPLAAGVPRHVVAFAPGGGERREPLFVSHAIARILELSDGTRTAREIADQIGRSHAAGARGVLPEIEEMFVSGLLWLNESPSAAGTLISGLHRRQSADSAPPTPANDDRLAGAGTAAAG
jgi:hypothetical protein